MGYEIFDGAIFIADAHANLKNRVEFRRFLQHLCDGTIKTTQLFLMGDMFDFLSDSTYVKSYFTKEIELINQLSCEIDTFYFEGNHDFNLKDIFPNAKVFDFSAQPLVFWVNGVKISLAHGDNGVKGVEKIALLALRNRKFLNFMDILDGYSGFKISKMILDSQLNKQLYKKLDGFRDIILSKISTYESKIALEGHYHQGVEFDLANLRYINLASFAVSGAYYRLNLTRGEFSLDENFLNKDIV